MLTVADIMTWNPVTVQRTTTLGEVIGLMKTHACRQVPVVEDGQLIGIVSDRDIRLAMNSPLILHERGDDLTLLNTTTAEVCMTPGPLTIESNAPATQAAALLRRYKFGGLPVLERGRLVGIVTISDILGSYITLLNAQEKENLKTET